MATPIREALQDVRARIRAAAERANRDPSGITLVAVSKGIDVERVEAALEAGVTDLGESRVQETQQRLLPLRDRATFHLIGHLQTNKAKFAVELYDWVHSVDSPKLARILDERARAAGRTLRVLVEVNTSGETSKHGVPPDELIGVLDALAECPALHMRGLMTIGPRFGGDEGARASFRILRGLRSAVGDRMEVSAHELHLSMGMSDDFEIAIEEGATIVRVGSAIFGHRDETPF